MNPDYEPEAYDITCRGCDWRRENIAPALTFTFGIRHIQDGCNTDVRPQFALRVAEGFLGTDPDNPMRTPGDGWNRSPRGGADV